MVEMNALKRTTSATAKMLASYDVSIPSSITTKGGDIVVGKPQKQPGDGSCLFHSLASELRRLRPNLSIDAFELRRSKQEDRSGAWFRKSRLNHLHRGGLPRAFR